jgi:hypothetical protein
MIRDDIDIFEYNLGGSVSGMIPKSVLEGAATKSKEREPLITEEQLAYFAAQMVPGAATIDAAGGMPGMPSSDADMTDIFDAENNLSFFENIRQGNILDPSLQALGVLGDATYAIPALGATLGSALKAPGALRKAMKITGLHGSPTKFDKFDLSKRPLDEFGLTKGLDRHGLGFYFTGRSKEGKTVAASYAGPDGFVYKVEVPKDKLLDMTTDLSGQPAKLKKELEKILPEDFVRANPSAKEIDEYVSIGPNEKLFRSPDGIQYGEWDSPRKLPYGGKYLGGNNTSGVNFVVADDSIIEISKISSKTGGIDNLPQNIARAPDGIESVDAARETIAAIEHGTSIGVPIRTTPIFQEFGIDRVREVEAALKRQQGDLLSVDDMVRRAESANPSFQANVDKVAQSVGGKKADKFIVTKDGSDFDVEVKSVKSISDKVERRGLTPADFTDGVRTTIYIDSAAQADDVVNQIGSLYTTIDRGWQRIPETGYFDRKMNLLVPDPVNGKMIVGEIQIKTPEMAKAAIPGHRWYEISRKLEGRYNHIIPTRKVKTYNSAMGEQNRLYSEAAENVDSEILRQLVDKFNLGGVVGAGPQFFRMSFQS